MCSKATVKCGFFLDQNSAFCNGHPYRLRPRRWREPLNGTMCSGKCLAVHDGRQVCSCFT